MIRTTLILLSALPLMACATLANSEDRLGVQCNADRVQPLVGREATPDLVTRAQERAGARSTRVIKPGDMVTQDFRSDRLNLDVDANNIITAARCG